MTWQYGETEIRLEADGIFRFLLDGESKEKDTLRAAQETIDRHENAKTKVAKRKISLDCINENGEPVVITGIHASSGRVLTTPRQQTYGVYGNSLYSAKSPAKDLLQEKSELEAMISKVERKLSECRVRGDDYTFKRLIETKGLESAYANIEESYAKASGAKE